MSDAHHPSTERAGADAGAGLHSPAFDVDGVVIHQGDCLAVLRSMPDASVQMCVTSPPYFGLRDYGVDGQIGLEPTPDAYVAKLVEVFREVRRVMRDDGTLWLNLGDSYASGGRKSRDPGQSKIHPAFEGEAYKDGLRPDDPPGIKPKDLIGIPWMVAFALRADGWYLRQDIIWHKPNPMPESVEDRCTKAHEYIFLLSKSDRYFYDAAAIMEPSVTGDARRPYTSEGAWEMDGRPEEQRQGGKLRNLKESHRGKCHNNTGNTGFDYRWSAARRAEITERNRRSVWTVNIKPFAGAHFATFPPDLIEPCVKAGSRPGDVVLDPFNGSGTTGAVAQKWGRRYVGIELNPEYVELSKERFKQRILFGGAA